MLYDENPNNTLYVYEDTSDSIGEKRYIEKTTETNTVVWNNLRVQHGSDYDPAYSKILLIINDFIPNYRKYRDVIEHSILIHSDKILISNKNISDFI
jgi:hypothetical protein